MDTIGKAARGFLLLCITGLLISACSDDPDSSQSAVQINLDVKENYVVQCNGVCDSVATAVVANGGQVTNQYSNINALSINLPVTSLASLEKAVGMQSLAKDRVIGSPKPANEIRLADATSARRINLDNTKTVSLGNTQPRNYLYNTALTGISSLHARDITGTGVIVAVIDSGTANNPDVVPALAGSVIGGENFVDLPDEPSATSILNESHGTWIGSMIAAHVGLIMDTDSPFVQSLLEHAPESVIPENDTESLIPMIGAAPDASLYALKVFDAAGSGALSSVVLLAMDRALTLKRNFNKGMPSEPVDGDGSEDNPYIYNSLNIQVVNMSLGGETMFPGLSVDDILVREMVREGISVVVAAGNDGYAAITGGSPGTSVAAITVGAVTTPQHERVSADLQFGNGIGKLYRPNNTTQTAYFSSRGPTADGRTGLQLTTNGFASFVQGADGDIAFVSGTSLSTPTVSGAAALLWQAFPDADASAVRSALRDSADANLIEDNNMMIDRGKGLLQLDKAYALLAGSGAEGNLPDLPDVGRRPTRVADNINKLNLRPVDLSEDGFSMDVTLIPGQVKHFFVPTSLTTRQIVVDLKNFSPEMPVEQQNSLFEDAILLTVADAPTSWSEFLIDERLLADNSFSIDYPQSGLVRVAVMGDWTNAGSISATLELHERQRRLSKPFKRGSLRDEEVDKFSVKINRRTTQLNFELSWGGDWGSYPPHDIDLIVLDPNDEPWFDAATLDSPERLTVDNPVRGKWKMLVTGYMLHGFRDSYELRITDQNGRVINGDDD